MDICTHRDTFAFCLRFLSKRSAPLVWSENSDQRQTAILWAKTAGLFLSKHLMADIRPELPDDVIDAGGFHLC